ncbi:hypothetical protein Scep_025233 [Stephania cephalantha]|uniref:Cytokinin riboside 5'-monophosphate phosphoribohydrolase n=1 Tax=Stephania cephalantha TaxID=152367 RepID=A0AAP0HP37_9MAGN
MARLSAAFIALPGGYGDMELYMEEFLEIINVDGYCNSLLALFDNGSGRCQVKKKVRFADDVVEPSSNNEKY